MAYVSEHLSLATLEVLAHAENLEMLNQYVALEISLPEDSLTILQSLPENWQENPPPDSTRHLGNEWLKEGATLMLKVPSVLIPNEHNYLINPNHALFSKVEVAEPVPLPFDARVLEVTGHSS